jgi:hypothetical protein
VGGAGKADNERIEFIRIESIPPTAFEFMSNEEGGAEDRFVFILPFRGVVIPYSGLDRPDGVADPTGSRSVGVWGGICGEGDKGRGCLTSNSNRSRPVSTVSVSVSGLSMSGRSGGTAPVHPASHRARHSPSIPTVGENFLTPSHVRSHSASAIRLRQAATLYVAAVCF